MSCVFKPMPEYVKKITLSKAKGKKYTAHTSDGRKIHFGSSSYGQYFDSTALRAFRAKDHKDPKRRKNYFKRHSNVTTKREAIRKEKKKSGGKLNSKILSHTYLW